MVFRMNDTLDYTLSSPNTVSSNAMLPPARSEDSSDRETTPSEQSVVDHNRQSAQTMDVLGTHSQQGSGQLVSDAAGPPSSDRKAPEEGNLGVFSWRNMREQTLALKVTYPGEGV